MPDVPPELAALLAISTPVPKIKGALQRGSRTAARRLANANPRGFWQFTTPRGIASLASITLQRIDIVLVAILMGPGWAAVYTAAQPGPIKIATSTMSIRCSVMDARLAIPRGVVNCQKPRGLAFASLRAAVRLPRCRAPLIFGTGVEMASSAASSGGTSGIPRGPLAGRRLIRRTQSQATAGGHVGQRPQWREERGAAGGYRDE